MFKSSIDGTPLGRWFVRFLETKKSIDDVRPQEASRRWEEICPPADWGNSPNPVEITRKIQKIHHVSPKRFGDPKQAARRYGLSQKNNIGNSIHMDVGSQ